MKKTVVFWGISVLACVLGTRGVSSAELSCSVCAGVRVDDPAAVLDVLRRDPKLGDEDVLFLAWTLPLDGTADLSALDALRQTGATPWLRVVFCTPTPIEENFEKLESELEELAAMMRGAGEGLFVQVVWQPENGSADARENAFLIKRAAVTVTGSAPGIQLAASGLDLGPPRAYRRAPRGSFSRPPHEQSR